MNLPQITAVIGAEAAEVQDVLDAMVKETLNPQPKLKEGDQPYAVFLTFDLKAREIRFEDPQPLTTDTVRRFYYFGNNKAAESQYYLVRETHSLPYLLSTVWNDLVMVLAKNSMEESELFGILHLLESAGLVTLTGRKGDGAVALDRLVPFGTTGTAVRFLDKKKMVVGGETLSYEEVVRRALGASEKRVRILLVVPAVKNEAGEMHILSQHPDYLTLVKRVNRLEETGTTGKVESSSTKQVEHVCAVCRVRKPGVHSGYSVSFNRTGINKIFTTTTINYASQIEKKGHDRVYGICNACYQKLRSGETAIEKQFRTRIAGENAFILPEGVREQLEYQYIERLYSIADFAFYSRDAAEWIRSVEAEAEQVDGLYSLNFIIYRTDGKSVTVLQTIEDVPLLRLHRIMHLFAETVAFLQPHLRGMSLGSIYRIIPVRKTEKGQVDVQRVLTFYKSLLSGEKVYAHTLMGYAVEALDKGMRQLSKQRVDNFENLNLRLYAGGREDFYIKNIVMAYLALFRVCERLGILDKPVFMHAKKKGSDTMGDKRPSDPDKRPLVELMEEFLEKQAFTAEARALFYLGAIINRVAWKQYEKNHKSKPVLNKINFQGMPRRDILRLYEEVLDLAKYYFEGLPLYIEQFIERFHHYFGPLERNWPLNEQANVFYLMAGYGFLVKGKSGESERDSEETEVNSDIPTENN
ncbi:MAG TPA: CRISPR-associated protein [Alicyclobacillus sp.]|nr:CRISPR-associated protein [Alicyclobacillus sp.]